MDPDLDARALGDSATLDGKALMPAKPDVYVKPQVAERKLDTSDLPGLLKNISDSELSSILLLIAPGS